MKLLLYKYPRQDKQVFLTKLRIVERVGWTASTIKSPHSVGSLL